MGLVEDTKVALIIRSVEKMLPISTYPKIPVDGLQERLNVCYQNRTGMELAMDVFKPIVDHGTKLPVIIYIHGGALIAGSKNISVGFCRQLAKRGYLVFSLEYRLIPKVRVYEQFDDVCAGMDAVEEKFVEFEADSERVYLVAESAGAYLATYVTAMKKSQVLRKAIGYEPSRISFKAMGLISGMFYTMRKDKIGWFLSSSIYGKDECRKRMVEYANPEHPEIINNILPCYLVTSKADFLERYTLDFAGELGNKGKEHVLRHMGSDPKLIHAFPVLRPDLPESALVIDEIVGWFQIH